MLGLYLHQRFGFMYTYLYKLLYIFIHIKRKLKENNFKFRFRTIRNTKIAFNPLIRAHASPGNTLETKR